MKEEKEKKEEKKEGKKKEKKERKEEFFEGGEFIPLKYCFSIVCVFPLLTFKLLLKVILHFIPSEQIESKTKTKKKQKQNKKIFSNRVVHM